MILIHSKYLLFILLSITLVSCNDQVSTPSLLTVTLSAPHIQLIKTYEFDTKVTKHPFEGISGIDYDNSTQQYIAITDDKAEEGPARYYKFQLDKNFKISNIKEKELFDSSNQKFELKKVDAESIRYISPTKFIWASELGKDRPNVFIYDSVTGTNEELELPEEVYPSKDLKFGSRKNNFIEGIAISPNKKYLLLSLEAPLIQDDNLPSLTKGGKTRVLVYDLKTLSFLTQFFYYLDPISTKSTASPPLHDNGISEIMFINERTILVLERSGRHVGDFNFEFDNRVYSVNLEDIHLTKQQSAIPNKILQIEKKIFLDFSSIKGLEQPNLEAMTLGPKINDLTSLIFISDNNFNTLNKTKLLIFTLGF